MANTKNVLLLAKANAHEVVKGKPIDEIRCGKDFRFIMRDFKANENGGYYGVIFANGKPLCKCDKKTKDSDVNIVAAEIRALAGLTSIARNITAFRYMMDGEVYNMSIEKVADWLAETWNGYLNKGS